MLNVGMLNVIMLNVGMLKVIMLNVILLTVVMLIVVVPPKSVISALVHFWSGAPSRAPLG